MFEKSEIASLDDRVIASFNALTILYNSCSVVLSVLVLVAIAFVAGGLGLLLRYHWWQPVTVGAVVFSTLVFILLWNGGLKGLDDQGGIGVLINLAILVIALIVKWPR